MASSFLKKKAREREALVDKEYGANAYGGSDWRKNRDEDTPDNEVNNTPGGGNAAGSNETGRKASSFLQKKATERASAVDKQHGEEPYGGSKWMDTQLSADAKTEDDDQSWWERIKDAASTAYDRVYGKDDDGEKMPEELRPVYKNDIAAQKMDAVTSAESTLRQTRDSGMDIETEIQRRGDHLKNLDNNVQRLADAYKQNPTEDNYNRLMSAAQQLDQSAKGYSALYDEYTGLVDSYNAAYKDYSSYMDNAKSDASGWKIAGDTVMAGIGSIARGIGSTMDFILPAELWDEKDPLSRFINAQAEEAKYLNDKWQESIYGRGTLIEGASTLGKATVEAIPNAILAMMSGGTSVAAQGTAALGTAATSTGIASTIGNTARTMAKNPMYWSSMAQTLGPTYEEAKANGANEWQASAAAMISSMLNAGVEVSGGIEVLPAKLKSGNKNAVLEWVLSTPEEGVEEVIQRFISGTTDKVIYDYDKPLYSTTDPDAIVNPKEMGKEFAMGTAVAGVLGGVQIGSISAANAALERMNNKRLGNIGTDYQVAAEDLVAEGLSFAPETEAYQTAQEVKAKMDAGEAVTDAELGRVVVANERTMQAEERLAQANAPRNTADSKAPDAVSDVSGKADTQPVRNENIAEAASVVESDPLMDAAREAVGANASLKQTVPYNVMSDSNPDRKAYLQSQKDVQKRTGYGTEGAKLFAEIAQASKLDDGEIMVRFDTPYQTGLTGLPMDKANLANDFQLEAYNAGRLDYVARMAADERHVPRAILSEAESGFDHTGAPADLTQAQKDFAVWIAKKMGVKGSWDGREGVKYNAFFDPDSDEGIVSFAKDFGIDPKLMEKLGSMDYREKVERLASTRDESFIFYVAHEIAGHVAMDRAPKEMRAFANSMYNYLQSLEGDENLARSKQAFYSSRGVNLDTPGAIEEVMSDAILKLYDGDEKKFMDAMRRVYENLDEDGKKGARTYLDMLKDFIEKLKAWARKLTGRESAEARANLEKGITELERLRNEFEAAIGTSMQNVREARKNPPKQKPAAAPSTGENIKHSIKGFASAAGIDASRDPATGKVIFKIGDQVVSKITPAHIKNNSGLGGLITTALDNGFISGEEATIQYKAAADIMNMIINTQDPDMVWAWVGSSMFSAIKSNADGQYGTTIDFTTVCRKTQDMITAMSKAMMKLKRGLTKDEVTKLQANLIAEGSSVPCPVCYVFSRWAGIGSVLDNMHRWQEKYDGYTDAQLNRQIAELTEKLGKGKAKDLAKMLREQDEEYDDLSFEKEKLALEKKQLNSKKKKAVKENDAHALVDINNRLAEIDKRNPQINKRLKDIKASVAPELAWLMQVRSQPDYEAHGKVRDNVLFNLDDAATFAEEFPLAWKYRTSRGPSAGKAILPYSDARVGDVILGVGHTSADGNKAFANVTGKFTDAQNAYVKKAIDRAKAQNLIGGQRFQSTSDFRYDYALDYLQEFWELQAIGSKMQTYTKIVEFGDMVAAVGGDFNLSVMPRNKGYITLPNGKNQLVFSSVTGIDFEAAKRSSQMHDNGQLILVGINDQHILAALEDSEETRGAHIGFVIPYHASGASINEFIRVLVSNLGETYKAKSYQDYSDVQSDKERSNATADQKRRNDLRTKLLRGKDGGKNWEPSEEDKAFIRGESKSIVGRSFAELREIERKALRGDKAAIAEYESWTAGALWDLYNKMWGDGGKEYGVRLNTAQAHAVMPHEYWNKTVNRDQAYINGFLFRSYCYNLGLTPRFTGAVVKGEKHGDFTDSKGYWKLLIDRPMYNNDGTYRDQQIINMSKFNMEMLKPSYAQENWAGYAVQEPDVQKATRAADKFVANEAGRAVDSDGKMKYSMKEDGQNGREKTVSHPGYAKGTREAGEYDAGGARSRAERYERRIAEACKSILADETRPAGNRHDRKETLESFRRRAVAKGLRHFENPSGTRAFAAKRAKNWNENASEVKKVLSGWGIKVVVFDGELLTYKDGISESCVDAQTLRVSGNTFLFVSSAVDTDGLEIAYHEAFHIAKAEGKTAWRKEVEQIIVDATDVDSDAFERFIRELAEPYGYTEKDVSAEEFAQEILEESYAWYIGRAYSRNGRYMRTLMDAFSDVEIAKAKLDAAFAQYNSNEDIRFSLKVTPEEDAAYMDAYFDGDDDLMQEMVDEAAQKAGYTYKAYHRTENAFTVFDRSKARRSMDIQGFYFSADPYAEMEYGSVRYDTYLKMTKPYIVDSREAQRAIPFDMRNEKAGVVAREWLQEHGYDGVIRKAEYFGAEADEYIVFEPSQIKSADPMTFEDDEYGEGEVIPLSERFNESNDDIRYSLKGEKAMRDEIKRIRTEGAKAGKGEAEIENDIMAVVGPEYGELIKTYGEIKRGERPAREIEVPRKTEEGRHVSQTIRTVLEAEATPDAAVPTIEQLIAQGDFSYDVITDKAAMEGAKKVIRTKGYETALAEWASDVKEGKVSKANTAIGWELYNAAANAGDLKTAMTILDGMIKHQRNAAQAVQATRILKKLSPDAQLYGVKRSVDNLQEDLVAKYGKKAPDLEIDEALARKLLEAKTDEERDVAMREIYQDIGRQIPASFVDKWNAWRYLAMLGNPRTHVRNVVGNLGFAPVVVTKDLAATLIESVVGFVSRGKMGRTKAMPNPALLKAAWDDYANAADQITGGGKYNDAAVKNQFIEEGRVIFKTKALEKARKANSAALEKEDVWFARPHYAFALAQYCKAHGVTADQLRRGKALGNARAYAIKEAQKATYRDTNAFSETISELGRYHGDNKVKKGVSMVTEGILPFRKTPANILMRGLEYSPMGLLKGLTWDLAKVKKGDITAADAIDNIAAGMTGTALLGLGVYLAAEGLIRGAGGGDEDEKEFEELQGHQAYALELPDGTSMTLDWLAPEVLPLFIGVNLYEMALENKGDSNLSDILTAVSNVTEPLLEMSCLQSLNDLFDSVGYATSGGLSALPTALSSAATSYLTQAFPTILGQAERSAQDVRMTTYTEKDKFLTTDMQYTLGKVSAKIPGWDFNQIPYIDAWGRAESTGSQGENAANNFLNPAYTSQIETSAMEEELQRLYEATGESSVLPSRAQKKFTVNKEDKHLTAEEYVEYATERGQMAYDLLTDLTSRPEYRNASDAEKADAVERAYEYATAIAKTKVSDYEPVGWVAKALEAEKFSGMGETEYMLYKLALDMVDQPNENGELGTYTAEEKSAAIASRRGLNNADIAAIWDTDDGYDLYDNGIDMRSYVEYVGTGGSVSAEKLIDVVNKGVGEETYYDFLDKLKEVDQPTESGKMGSYTQDEAKAAVAAIPGLSRAERAALWQSVNKNWKAKNNPWR